MRFMFIVHATKNSEAGVPPDPRLMAAIGKLSQERSAAGEMVLAGGLLPSAKGKRARLAGGKVTFTDGPFTEAKEVVGGFAIIDFPSMEAAVEANRRFWEIHAEVMGPGYEGSGEIRPMMNPADTMPR